MSTKLNASDSDIGETFKSMNQSIMTKIKNSASEDWIEIVVKLLIFLSELNKWR